MRQVYQVLLRLYPQEYQTEFAGEMLAVFTSVAKERRALGRIAYTRFVVGECAGLLTGALRERSVLWLVPVLGGIGLATALYAGFYTALVRIVRGTSAIVGRSSIAIGDERELVVTVGMFGVTTLLCLLPLFFLLSIRLNRRRR